MSGHYDESLVDELATIWSGAPYPSTRSRVKAEAVLDRLVEAGWGPLAGIRAGLVRAQADVAGDGELDAWERGYVAATKVALTAIDKATEAGRG